MTPRDRFDAGIADELPEVSGLHETDRLLDRLGGRRPQPGDLDDPLLAVLAEFAIGADLDPVAPEKTRRSLSQEGAWPLRQDLGRPAPDNPILDDPIPDDPTPPTGLPRVPQRRSDLHRRPPRAVPPPLAGLVSSATPRALGSRLVPAAVAASVAGALSMGAAAALSGGDTFNPASVVDRVIDMAQIEDPPQIRPAQQTRASSSPSGQLAGPADPGVGDAPGGQGTEPTTGTQASPSTGAAPGVGAASVGDASPGPQDAVVPSTATTGDAPPAQPTSGPGAVVPNGEPTTAPTTASSTASSTAPTAPATSGAASSPTQTASSPAAVSASAVGAATRKTKKIPPGQAKKGAKQPASSSAATSPPPPGKNPLP